MIPQYVFIAPHADDELLSMGAAIVQHVQVHGPDRVAVVLASTGESSGARRAFRAGVGRRTRKASLYSER